MKTRESGFSLVELLIVVALISILAAVSLPSISEFLRNYKIRGATQQVANELNSARTKSIMRNVNRGALFVILPDTADPNTFTRYQWVMPEQTLPLGGAYRPLDQLQVDRGQAGPALSLPAGLRFVRGGNAGMVGFTRLGAMCDPATNCGIPAVALGAAVICVDCVNFNAGAATSTVTILQDRDQQQRTVTVMGGGRILAQP